MVKRDPDAVHTAIRLRTAISRLTRVLRSQSAPDGPGAAKLGVLGQLYRLGELTPTRLAGVERVRVQTLTRLLAELEDNRLIRRRPDPDDARRTLLSISASGVRLLSADIRRREASLAAAIADVLRPAERRLLLEACRHLDAIGDALPVLHGSIARPVR